MQGEDPLIVIWCSPIAMADQKDGARVVKSPDFQDDGVALIPALVNRLKAFGFNRIVLEAYAYTADWISASEKMASRERADQYAKNEGVPIRWYPEELTATDADQKNLAAFFMKNFDEADDTKAVILTNRSLLVPENRIRKMLSATRDDQPVMINGASSSWEMVRTVSKSYYAFVAENGRLPASPAPDPRFSTISPSTLPSTLRFGFTREFNAVFKSMANAAPREWSYDLVQKIYTDEPERFFSIVRHVGVEVTNDDNLPNRIRSPREISQRPIGRISLDNWSSLIDSLDTRSTTVSLDLWDFGEPLLHDDIVAMIAEAAKKGIRVDLYTNGILVDKKMADALLTSGLDAIFFRIDAATEAVYKRVNGGDKHFEAVRNNIAQFLSLKKSLRQGQPPAWKPIVAVQITEMPETKEDFSAFKELYDYRSKIEAEHGQIPLLEQFAKIYEKYPPLEYSMIRHDNLMRGRIVRNGGMDVTPIFRFACRQIQTGPYILWNGDVTPCRQDHDGNEIIGHVKDGIRSIMTAGPMKSYHRAHAGENWAAPSLCANCKEWFYNFE